MKRTKYPSVVEACTIDPYYYPGVKFALMYNKLYIRGVDSNGTPREWSEYSDPATSLKLGAERTKELLIVHCAFDEVLGKL